jgi:hypothetical protein
MKIRKNQKDLTAAEWDKFICAFQAIQEGLLKGVDKPSLDDFADEHAAAFKEKNHYWHVHSHDDEEGGHWGVMFFAWHRVFLNEFENRLRREEPSVTIPYWNAFKDPFPEELKKISDNEGKRVDLNSEENLFSFAETDFYTFQHDLETRYHDAVHAKLGGTMVRGHSPRDAAFWLHHAFVDSQWGHWFEKQNGTLPPGMGAVIQGEDIIGDSKKVEDVLHTPQLGYVYGNGICYNIVEHGSDSFASPLEKGMILCAKLDNEWYTKMLVYALSSFTATILLQHFPFLTPSTKLGVFPSETMYVDLKTGKWDVAEDQAHVKFTKKSSETDFTYVIEAVNGTKLARFTRITDFTANNGEGASDYDMLYI